MTDIHDPNNPQNPYYGLTDLTGEEPLPALEDPGIPPAQPPRSPLLTALIIALLLVALSVAFFQLLRSDADTADGSNDPTTTTEAADDGQDAVSAGPGTPTSTTTTTIAAQVEFDPYEAVGEPIDLADLTMVVGGIGPLEFGTPASDAVGRLVASLGEPNEDTGPRQSTGAFGVCVGETERIVRWGPLAAIVTVENGVETFNGYRVDISYQGAASHPAADIATLSGLRVADAVSQLERIYGDSFEINYEVDAALGETFRLIGNSGLLLWGPVTSSESSGSVIGIYATDVCER